MTDVVTVLKVDSSGAVVNLKDFEAAMTKAGQTAANSVATMTAGPQSMAGISKGWEKVQASVDPVFAAQVNRQKQVESAFRSANAAVAAGMATHDQAANVVGQVAAKYDALTANASKAAFAHTTLGRALTGVSGQLIALSAGAGPVGVFLASLGPWGVAAAVGLGATEGAISGLSDSANRMSELSRMLRDSAQTMGISTDQLQALNIAAASVGVSTDKNATSFERFTVQLNELRNGTGTLYTQLLAVDRSLVTQLASTKDITTAIDLLARSYANATDQVQKNAIARAAFGRAGFDEGRVLSAINTAGGLDNYKAGLNDTDILTQNQIQHWATLGIEIEHATSVAKNNLASIFTGPVLEAQKTWVDRWLEASRLLKEFSTSADFKEAISDKSFANLAAAISSALGFDKAAAYYKSKIPEKTGTNIPNTDPFGTFDVGGSYTGAKEATNAQFNASQYKEMVAALGSAASAAQKLHERQLTLLADFKAGKIDADTYNRALAGAGVEFATTAINARVSALGLMASSTDIATQAQLKINKANLDGANVSKSQAALIKEAAQLQFAATKQNTDASFGLATETDILDLKTKQFLNTANQLRYSEEQRAQGLLVVKRNAKEAYEQSQIAASATPQLAQLAFDSANLNKQFDTFAVSGLNDVSNAFVGITMRTAATGDAFRNLGLQVVTAIDQMIIKMLVMQPIAKALQATIGGFSGGGGGFFGSLFGGAGGFGDPMASANGNVFSASGHVPFANGGIVTRPTLFPFANGTGLMGEAGPEAIMPLKRGPDGRLGVSGGGQGGGSPTYITYSPTIDARGADAAAVARLSKALADDRKNFGKNVLAVTGKARLNMQAA